MGDSDTKNIVMNYTKETLDGIKADMGEVKKDFREFAGEFRKDVKYLSTAISDLSVLVAGNYATKDDLENTSEGLRKNYCNKCKLIEDDVKDKHDALVIDIKQYESANSSFHTLMLGLFFTYVVGTVGMFYYIFALYGNILTTLTK